MKNTLIKLIPAIALILIPAVSFAAFNGTIELINGAGTLVTWTTRILVSLALLVFFWGLVKFIFKAGDEAAVEEGRRIMIWGVVALFVLVSVWGLVRFLQGELLPGGNYNPPPIPSL